MSINKQSIESEINSDTILFFDLDGTLVDTNYANFLSYKKAILSIKNSEYKLKYISNTRFNRSYLKNIIPNLNEKEYQDIIKEKENCYKEFLSETTLNDELSEILYKYSKKNKIVLVTNSFEDRALATLNYHNLTNKFDHILCRNNTEKNEKTNKYKNAISILNILPQLVLLFEDEESEIIDAKNVGINNTKLIKIKTNETVYNLPK